MVERTLAQRLRRWDTETPGEIVAKLWWGPAAMRPPARSILRGPAAGVKSSEERFSTFGKTAITECDGRIG